MLVLLRLCHFLGCRSRRCWPRLGAS